MTLLSRKHHQNSNSGAATGHVAAETHPQAEHSHTEDYVSAGAHAAVSQIFRELTDKQNMAILSGLILEQAGNLARQAGTQEGRAGARIAAQEAVTGSYDAVERKWKEAWEKLPRQFMPIALGGCIFVGTLLMGLFLAIWRFVLFGLQ